MFEPFFTTKEKGKGTGLGLATVYGIVKQSGGYIWVNSEPQCGTTFNIYLPLAEGSAETRRRIELSAKIPMGNETILLVEDEGGVREVAREFLKLSGYQVLEAENGAAALEIAQKYAGPIDVLLTDMKMPGMGGLELARQMTRARPGVKVVFMTGYNEHVVFEENEMAPGAVVLQKPFARESLSRAVREVLDR
jgi:CheY-like chemotaxis protein